MQEFLWSPIAQVVIWSATLAIMTLIGFYVVLSFRDRTDQGEPTSSKWMTNYREMHHEGDISDEEYRTIKTVLNDKLQEELKDIDEAG